MNIPVNFSLWYPRTKEQQAYQLISNIKNRIQSDMTWYSELVSK